MSVLEQVGGRGRDVGHRRGLLRSPPWYAAGDVGSDGDAAGRTASELPA